MRHKILKIDPYLAPYKADLDLRADRFREKCAQILGENGSLSDFANGHRYFGFHRTESGWFYREWAPGADRLFLTGDFCGWDRTAYPMEKLENGLKDYISNSLIEGYSVNEINFVSHHLFVKDKVAYVYTCISIEIQQVYPIYDELYIISTLTPK